MDKEVVAVSKKADKYFVVLEDDSRIQVDSEEFQRVKKYYQKVSLYFWKQMKKVIVWNKVRYPPKLPTERKISNENF